jgi:hypothetical protein
VVLTSKKNKLAFFPIHKLNQNCKQKKGDEHLTPEGHRDSEGHRLRECGREKERKILWREREREICEFACVCLFEIFQLYRYQLLAKMGMEIWSFVVAPCLLFVLQ